jgi:hypothetical protein
MEKEKCALCNKVAPLKKSHIIPKFVSKWLKETSATGFLRGIQKPQERKQDLPKLPLLCENCEQILSRLENYFASNIFYPVLNEQKKEIDYDERLLLFVISLSWRTLKTSYFAQVKYSPWIKEHLDKAEEVWRKCLLTESINEEQYEHHIVFFDYVKTETGMPDRLQWYTLRATDSTLASNKETVFAFTHFPHIFFVSSIYPPKFSGWENTKVEKNGKLTMKWKIEDTRFGGFLINRGKKAMSSLGVSADNRILKSMKKKPERMLKSESLKVMIEESKRTRLKRIRALPKGIRFLIDIIDRSLDSPKLNLIQQSWDNYTRHIVAEALSNIPVDGAKIIDALIESTVTLTDDKHRQNHIDFETRELVVRFMVSICDDKNEQIELLRKSLDALIKKKAKNDQRIIVVFSFNPYDEEMPYETAYYT